MQIVIDVPDSYSFRKSLFEGSLTNDQILDVYRSARNGIILPKGHGRLADMDEAIKCIEEAKGEDARWAIGLINWACDKRTLIPADKDVDIEYQKHVEHLEHDTLYESTLNLEDGSM